MTDTPQEAQKQDTRLFAVYLQAFGWRKVGGDALPPQWIDPATGTGWSTREAMGVAVKRQGITLLHWFTAAPEDHREAVSVPLAVMVLGALKAWVKSAEFQPAVLAWLADPDTKTLLDGLRALLRPVLRQEIAEILREETEILKAAAAKTD